MITYFNNKNWESLLDKYEAWWTNTLECPLLHITLHGADPKISKPEGKIHHTLSQYSLDEPVETIIKHWEYLLCTTIYIGDAYPTFLPDFGAGVNAAFTSAKVIVRPETVWFMAN